MNEKFPSDVFPSIGYHGEIDRIRERENRTEQRKEQSWNKRRDEVKQGAVSKQGGEQSGGKREAREGWRRRVEAKEQRWLVCYQQQVPVKQTFNVSNRLSLSLSLSR